MSYLRRKRGQDDPKMLCKKVDTPLAKSIREEIKRLADDESFTLGTLRAIERVAAHGRAMLQGTADLDGLLGSPGGGIGAIGYDTDIDIDGLQDDLMSVGPGLAISGSPPVENFGTRAMREMVAILPKILEGRNKPSTVELVRSLALARKEGLDDVAKDLEQQIKGAKETTSEPVAAAAPPFGELPRGAYWKPDDNLVGGRYIERGDPQWRIEEYNALTGENAKAEDFPRVTVDPPANSEPELGGAA